VNPGFGVRQQPRAMGATPRWLANERTPRFEPKFEWSVVLCLPLPSNSIANGWLIPKDLR